MKKIQIKNWGNSKGIRIPKNILTELNLQTDAELEISVDKETNAIILVVSHGLTPHPKSTAKAEAKERRDVEEMSIVKYEDFLTAMEKATEVFGQDPAYYGKEGEEEVFNQLVKLGYSEEELRESRGD